jgi:hypothetical protein
VRAAASSEAVVRFDVTIVRVEHVPETEHSAYFQRPEIFNQLVNDFPSHFSVREAR